MSYISNICNEFSAADLGYAYLISTPALFTVDEANYLKQLLQDCNCCGTLTAEQINSNNSKIILDFAKTTFIDREGLIGLLQILKLARNERANLTFSNFSSEVKMVLSLIGLETAFPL